jgi:hypothetical protein
VFKATAVLLALAAAHAASAAAAPVKTIGTAATVDYKIVLTAQPSSGGSAPTARVVATSYRRSRGQWQRTGAHRLVGTFFWYVVSGPRAVCELSIVTATRRARPHATVRLLVSPSIGCSRSYTIDLTA